MSKQKHVLFFILVILSTTSIIAFNSSQDNGDDFVTYKADLQKVSIKLYWKNDNGERLKNLEAIKKFTETQGEKLLFAMNGGMYKTDRSPLGLFIQDGKTIAAINKSKADGNFYLLPNGIFYITKNNKAAICKTQDFINSGNIQYATQSGPILVINRNIHSAFKQG